VAAAPLPGVEGRIDHLSVDVQGQRLFVAALGNDTVEVVDLASMRVVKSVRGMNEPQGIRFLPDERKAIVANGGTGATTFLDGSTLEVLRTAKFSGDADNVRYDQAAKRIYVGYGNGALGVLDTNGTVMGDIRLPAHPESFQLESSGPRIFVNVPSTSQVLVVNRTSGATVAKWPVTEASANYPMALDESHHRLFLGCRSPARLLVYDSDSGRRIASVAIAGDTDDLFYDAAARRIYVAGGEGKITAVEQLDADRYRVIEHIATAAGARTALFVPELRRLFLAVPHRGTQRAEIRSYAVD
jgi:DNA-binding beta-propeller fold protein YncE